MLETNTTTMTDIALEEDTRSYFAKVFQWMGIALAISGVIAWQVSQTPQLVEIIFGNKLYFYGMMIIELGLVRYLSANIKNLSLQMAGIMFVLYSAINGAILSLVFLVFELNSIISIFGATTAIFLVMGIYGYTTKSDLTKMWSLLFMGLIGIIIWWVINIFLKNQMFDFIITSIGVIIFVWLTAYDVQKLKQLNTKWDAGTDNEQKEWIIGALNLYLDFINLFLNLLKLFGKRK